MPKPTKTRNSTKAAPGAPTATPTPPSALTAQEATASAPSAPSAPLSVSATQEATASAPPATSLAPAAAMSEILTLPEAAVFLRVPEEGLKADAMAGRIPARWVAGDWRFSRSALIAWLSQPERPHKRFPTGVEVAAQLHEQPLPPTYAADPQQVEQEIAELATIRKTMWLVE
ncbi:MAG: helix-turn-helix domain-containing protein [Gemmataceae bacterium]|nr:helix-turn-helix domain-containing protein [Gemmata sp.]MDW8198277.1 helix-turn-helix domain-containing protein [Gemmataceae bacterium]